MNKNIRVVPLANLTTAIFEHRPAQVITLIDPNPKYNDDLARIKHISDNVQYFDHLSLRFADEDKPDDPDGPKVNHIDRIIAFDKPDADTIVCCNGGVARSSATCIGLLAARGLSAKEACEIAWANKKNIWPNTLIISMFDTKLGLGGILIEEVAKAKAMPRCIMCGEKVKQGENSCGCW